MKATNETYKVRIYISNVYEIYNMLQSLASCIEKKISKGIEINLDTLAMSSSVGKIVTELNKYLQKYDNEILSKDVRKEVRYIIANEIIDIAKDNIEYKKSTND